MQIRRNIQFGQNLFLLHHLPQSLRNQCKSENLSSPKRAHADQDKQVDPDLVFYREVDMSDLPSQYVEDMETFIHILNLPDPKDTMPRSSTTFLGLDDVKGQQELRQRGSFAMLPLSPYVKDVFGKNRTSGPLIYLRVDTSNPRLPLLSGIRWDSFALRIKCKN